MLLLEDDSPGTDLATTVASSTAPSTTSAPTSTAPATSTFTIVPVPVDFVVSEIGISGPIDSLVNGMDPADAVATGLITYPGPEFTVEVEGFTCGFGDGAGPLLDAFAVQFMDAGAVRYHIGSAALRTADGLGIGSTDAEVRSALGEPTETRPEHFGTGQELLYRRVGDGYNFTIRDGSVASWSVGFWDELHLVEGCL